MIARLFDAVSLSAALGAGLVAGAFFAFSTLVMPALARVAPALGIEAMQAINVAAINRWFLGALFGVAVACVVLAISALLAWHEPGARLRLAGAALYLIGTVGVTMACNVPRNEALDLIAPHGADALALWQPYLREWTAWNHVRTIAALAAAALLTGDLLMRR
jgi:uncharacterized membrane protein